MKEIRDRIRAARVAQGWSQKQLGARTPQPVSHAAINYIENGPTRLHLDLLMDLAHTLDVPVSYFLEPLMDSHRGGDHA